MLVRLKSADAPARNDKVVQDKREKSSSQVSRTEADNLLTSTQEKTVKGSCVAPRAEKFGCSFLFGDSNYVHHAQTKPSDSQDLWSTLCQFRV
ncbi:uncharacterized [Tachysurus ichikawai]